MIGNNNKGLPRLKAGFTLIEMLVSVTIFTMVMGAGSGIFISALRAQQVAIASQNLVESTRFTIEYMSRQIRLAQRDTSGTCPLVPSNTFYTNPSGTSTLAFKNSQSECIVFSLSGNNISVSIDGAAGVPITSFTAVNIADLTFTISGETRSDSLQPRVTIVIEARSVGDLEGIEASTYIQTTVSTRAIDV